jgi:hypothetical protein
LACFLAAAAAVIVAVLLFSNGDAGPAPVALAGAGGLIVLGVTRWRPARPRSGPYPAVPRNQAPPGQPERGSNPDDSK